MRYINVHVFLGFTYVNESSVVFGPSNEWDSWGTEDPRIAYNKLDGLYYMFYTAYNGNDILLNLATTRNPTSSDGWNRHGAVFPQVHSPLFIPPWQLLEILYH